MTCILEEFASVLPDQHVTAANLQRYGSDALELTSKASLVSREVGVHGRALPQKRSGSEAGLNGG